MFVINIVKHLRVSAFWFKAQQELFWFLLIVQDTGVSVRKRVIKIMREICLAQPDFAKIPDMCVKMIRRVGDEEGIKVH
jgi:hypothetical protein